MSCHHAGLLENSHKRFKCSYSLSTKKTKILMNEFIRRENRRITFNHRNEKLHESARQTNSFKAIPEEPGGAFFVKTGPTSTLGGVMQMFRNIQASTDGSQSSNQFTCFEKLFFLASAVCQSLPTFAGCGWIFLVEMSGFKMTQYIEKSKFQNLLLFPLTWYRLSKLK